MKKLSLLVLQEVYSLLPCCTLLINIRVGVTMYRTRTERLTFVNNAHASVLPNPKHCPTDLTNVAAVLHSIPSCWLTWMKHYGTVLIEAHAHEAYSCCTFPDSLTKQSAAKQLSISLSSSLLEVIGQKGSNPHRDGPRTSLDSPPV